MSTFNRLFRPAVECLEGRALLSATFTEPVVESATIVVTKDLDASSPPLVAAEMDGTSEGSEASSTSRPICYLRYDLAR